MNQAEIVTHLTGAGYDVSFSADKRTISVEVVASERRFTLVHDFPKQLDSLPTFRLANADTYGQLAHVLPDPGSNEGIVCVQNSDSLSINFEVPPKIYEASLNRHIALLLPLLDDPDWNRRELLREFHANWSILCSDAGTLTPELFCASSTEHPDGLQVKKPILTS